MRYALACLAAVMAMTAGAADLTLGPGSIQKLVSEQLFKQRGRWYVLDSGSCYAYFERPKTRLAAGRLILDAHLSARIGIQMGDSCVGSQIASNVTLSARPVGKGSSLSLQDIRIDRVEDNSARDALKLLQQIAPQALPKSVGFDLLPLIQGKSLAETGIPVSVDTFRILDTQTRRDAVVITFDLSLTAP